MAATDWQQINSNIESKDEPNLADKINELQLPELLFLGSKLKIQATRQLERMEKRWRGGEGGLREKIKELREKIDRYNYLASHPSLERPVLEVGQGYDRGQPQVEESCSRPKQLGLDRRIERTRTRLWTRMSRDRSLTRSRSRYRGDRSRSRSFDDDKDILEVSTQEATLIIGEKGSVIKAIQQKTGTQISILGRKGDAKQKIEILGPEKQVNIAKLMINQMKVVVGQLQDDEVGFLLKDGAKALHEIQEKTNTRISFNGKKGDSQRDVHIVGFEENKSKAWSLIVEQLFLRKA